MKFLDRFLQNLRFNQLDKFVPHNSSVLDIGCADGALYRMIKHKVTNYIGIDSNLEQSLVSDNFTLIPGKFPDVLPPAGKPITLIVALAVIEHIPTDKQRDFSEKSYACLEPGGSMVITTPSPFVDEILLWLTRLRLIDGMSIEQHYGFEPAMVPSIFTKSGFELIKSKKFQFGLNNLFVFQKPLIG